MSNIHDARSEIYHKAFASIKNSQSFSWSQNVKHNIISTTNNKVMILWYIFTAIDTLRNFLYLRSRRENFVSKRF